MRTHIPLKPLFATADVNLHLALYQVADELNDALPFDVALVRKNGALSLLLADVHPDDAALLAGGQAVLCVACGQPVQPGDDYLITAKGAVICENCAE